VESALHSRSLGIWEVGRQRGEVGFIVLAIELGTVPSLERRFRREIKKTSTRVSLEAYAPYNFPDGGAQLVLQKKIIFEQWEVGRNPQKSFTEVDKDCDLENGVGIQMDKFYLIMVQESTEEITSWKSKPTLEEG
jgi:hypothetical protein